jgi:hypothetical protein
VYSRVIVGLLVVKMISPLLVAFVSTTSSRQSPTMLQWMLGHAGSTSD